MRFIIPRCCTCFDNSSTSLLDKNKQEIHCMLSKSDFNILFNVLLEKIVNNSLKVKDYFQELTNNPETKLWIERK